MHPIFNHVQIIVDRLPEAGRGESLFHVTKVSLVYIPLEELIDQRAVDEFDPQQLPSSPPIVFPITIASFMDTASAPHKRKLPPPAAPATAELDEVAPVPSRASTPTLRHEGNEESVQTNKRRRTLVLEPEQQHHRHSA
jgi:hypothetical protein